MSFLCRLGKHKWNWKLQTYHQVDDKIIVIAPCKNCKELWSYAWYGKMKPIKNLMEEEGDYATV